MNGQNGFTILEVLIAISVLTIGIMAMQTMQTMAIGQNGQSGAITVKTMMAAGQIEEIMVLDYDDPQLDDVDGDGTGQDDDLDGLDDAGVNADFGLRHRECCPGGIDPRGNAVPGCVAVADHCAVDPDQDFEIYWNVAIDYPVENTKTINVIVVDSHDKADTNREAVNRAEYRYVKDDII